MEDRVYIEDHLKEVSLKLLGLSQLVMYTYDAQKREGLDAEYLLVMYDTILKCSDESKNMIEKL